MLLFSLPWDIGENIGALLQLTKQEFIRQQNPDTNEDKYPVNLPATNVNYFLPPL